MNKAILLGAATIMALAAVPAGAETYRWVDERGVVNYGDKPPKEAKATPIDDSPNQLPAAKPPETASAGPPPAAAGSGNRSGDDSFARELWQRQQAEEERRNAARRARCEAQRGIDCDHDPTVEAYDPGGAVVVVRPHISPRPVTKPPALQQTATPATAPHPEPASARPRARAGNRMDTTQ